MDDTFAAGFRLGVPTQSRLSRDTHSSPRIFNLLKLGDHISLQTDAAFDIQVGPTAGGFTAANYDAILGYRIGRDMVNFPWVESVTPMVSLNGQSYLHQVPAGENDLFTLVGFEASFSQLSPIPIQPKAEIGCLIPLNDAAYRGGHWEIVASLIFSY